MIRNLIRALTDEEVQRIHDESVTVLETVGLRVPHAKVLDICRKAGAVVDESAQTVKIPAAVINGLMNAALPRELPPDEPVTDLKGSISTQVFIVDYPGTERRRGTLDDVRRGIFVSDTLKNIWGSSAVVIPGDRPFNETDIASYREIYLYSKKPGGTYILSPTSGRGIIEMGRVMGRETGYLLETVSPLGFMTSSLEMALVFAGEGMPLHVAPMVIGGATGPMTIWGNAVLENAELLGTNFVIHAMTGRMAGYGAGNHTMDMRTTLCSFGSPNQALLGIAAAQMARHYGWQGGSNSALSDACLPDYQCGFEKAFNGLFAVLSGCAGIGCQGIVGADQGVSLEQLVLDNEWLDAYNYVLRGIEPDDESLELIQRVGIGGNFLQEDHTMLNMRRNIWEAPAKTFWRDQWETWSAQGQKDIYTRAHEAVERVTAGYRNAEPVLEPAKAAEIERIYADTCGRLARERENAK